jgi:hypothetical protein
MRRAPILARTRQGGGPAFGEEMLRQSSCHAEMIERAGLSRSEPRPRRSEAGPFCQEPGWKKNNVVFKSDVGARRHAEVIERRARAGRGWRKGVGRCQRSPDGRKQPRAALDVLAFDITAASVSIGEARSVDTSAGRGLAGAARRRVQRRRRRHKLCRIPRQPALTV